MSNKKETTYKQNTKQDSLCSKGDNIMMMMMIPLKSTTTIIIIIKFLKTEQPKGPC
jgi:hypothetical protein